LSTWLTADRRYETEFDASVGDRFRSIAAAVMTTGGATDELTADLESAKAKVQHGQTLALLPRAGMSGKRAK
jgi:hypothetical protein